MNKPIAAWTIKLEVECPKCGEDFDLLDHPNFWEFNPGLDIAEHSTKRADNVNALCSNCCHEFIVECVY